MEIKYYFFSFSEDFIIISNSLIWIKVVAMLVFNWVISFITGSIIFLFDVTIIEIFVTVKPIVMEIIK